MAVDDMWYLRKRSAMGDRIPSKRYGRGKRWRVRWVDPATGQTHTAFFSKKAAAERHDSAMQTDIARGQYVNPSDGKITVREYAERWRKEQLHRETTSDMIERAFRLHINPTLGGIALNQLRPTHVRSWVKSRSQTMANSTLRLVFSYLASMCRAAVQDKVIGSSPCNGVRLPQVEQKDYFVPTPQQIHHAARELYARYYVAPYLASGCGLRVSEVFGLELEHIDFERNEVVVGQQLLQQPHYAPRLAPVKTKTSNRTVELPMVVAEALRCHLEKYPPQPVEIDDATDPKNPIRRSARLLFTTVTGLPVTRSNWSPVWRSAVKRAGLPEGMGLHALRHYFATLLIHSGASVKTVQLALGHSSPMTTLETYAHEWPEAIERTRSLVDASLGS